MSGPDKCSKVTDREKFKTECWEQAAKVRTLCQIFSIAHCDQCRFAQGQNHLAHGAIRFCF